MITNILYFAYGSNMSLKQMTDRCIVYGKTSAKLEDYTLKFNKRSKHYLGTGFANIEKQEGGVVEGVLYEVDFTSIKNLDKLEGFPIHYIKEIIGVTLPSGEKTWAVTYIANPNKVVEGLLPRKEYLNKILEGRSFLSKEYVKVLEDQKTFD